MLICSNIILKTQSNLKIVFCAAAPPPAAAAPSQIVPPPQNQIRSDLIGLCKVPKEASR